MCVWQRGWTDAAGRRHLAQWLDEMPQLLAHDIRRVVSAQTAFFAPIGNHSLPFAEGHVHFWGVTADSAILDDYLLTGGELTLSGKANLWQREQHDSLQPLLQRAAIAGVVGAARTTE